jgi:cephalosporin hydroxylase
MAGLAVRSTADLVAEAMTKGAVQLPTELCSMADLLRDIKPRHIMEIGSEAGGTFWLWCQLACMGGIKISLDKPDGNSGSGLFSGPQALAERTELFKTFAPRVHVVTGDSHSPLIRARVRTILGEELLDFLFIDGDHSYDGVKADFQQYRELVRRGGLIALHDIKNTQSHRYRGCFVADFWSELPDANKTEFIAPSEWGGIGVVQN